MFIILGTFAPLPSIPSLKVPKRLTWLTWFTVPLFETFSSSFAKKAINMINISCVLSTYIKMCSTLGNGNYVNHSLRLLPLPPCAFLLWKSQKWSTWLTWLPFSLLLSVFHRRRLTWLTFPLFHAHWGQKVAKTGGSPVLSIFSKRAINMINISLVLSTFLPRSP